MKGKALSLIIREREKRGITQTEMANKISKKLKQTYSLRAYQGLEGGKIPKYKKDVIKAIDEILGLDTQSMIYEQNTESRKPASAIPDVSVEELAVMKARIKALMHVVAKLCVKEWGRTVEEWLQELDQNTTLILKDMLKGQ